jgi:ABC-type lipoprotein release transport system permease subunit
MKKILSAIINGVIELRYNVLRSSLSLIGIVLGVMNLSAMFSVMNGAKIANKQLIESIGSPDLVSVSLDWRKINEQGGEWWKYV